MDQEYVLNASKREHGKKSILTGLRKNGKIPAVLYGDDSKKNQTVSVVKKDLIKLMRRVHLTSHIFNLSLEEKNIPVLVKEFQYDPATDEIIHADFIKISPKKDIVIDVPIEFSGKAPGLAKGGILEFISRSVKVRAIPSRLPEKIVVDVSNLDVGGAIMARDLPIPEGVKLLSDPATVIVTVVVPKEEVVEEAAAVPAEGAAIEPEVMKKGKEAKEGEEAAAEGSEKKPAAGAKPAPGAKTSGAPGTAASKEKKEESKKPEKK
ncbi:MAG TPA: 50S ribosomal protein L25 [bacterium]|nr:50S ribosomal protein L25 [bacterium]